MLKLFVDPVFILFSANELLRYNLHPKIIN